MKLVQSSAVSDQPPYVLIAANPYEEKLVRRALDLTGLRVEGADGVDGLRARIAAERPLVVVAAEGWMGAELDEVLAAVDGVGEAAPPLFVVAAAASGRESAGRVRVFVRPVDVDALADAIEKLAVEAERARDAAGDDEVIPSEAIAEVVEPGEVELEADSEEDWRERPPSQPKLARIALARVAVRRSNGSAAVERPGARPPPPPPPKATPVSDLPRAHATSPTGSSVEPPSTATPDAPPAPPAPATGRSPSSTSLPALARLDELDDPFALEPGMSPPRVSPTQILPPDPAPAAPPEPAPATATTPAPVDPAEAATPLRASPTVRIGPARVELLRADDAMDDVTGFGPAPDRAAAAAFVSPAGPPDEPRLVRLVDVELPTHLDVSPAPSPTPPPPRELAARAAEPARPPQRFADRSTFARRLDDQLSEVERRLFPDAATSSMRRYDDYDDALDDIDLDNLGVDTLPGLSAERLELALSSPKGAPARPSTALDDVPTPAFDATPTPRLPTFDATPTPRVGGLLRDIPRALEGPADASPLDRLTASRAHAPRARISTPVPSSSSSSPSIDQPIARPLPEEGTFATTDACALLVQLHAAGFCGRLVATRGDGEKQLDFDGGTPVAARSSFAHDRLGDLLFREGKLTREQHARTRELSVEPGRKTAQLFVELGLLKANEIFPALRRQTEEILHSLFAWTQGAFRLVAAEVPAEERLRLSAHPWALYLEGVRRKYGLDRLADLVSVDAVLHPTTTLDQVLGDAALTPAERRVAEVIDGQRTVGELIRIGAAGARPNGLGEPPRAGDLLDEAGVYGLAWFLLSVGAVRTDAEEEGATARADVRAVSTVVEPIEAITDSGVERRRARRERADTPADRAVDRERVRAKRAQLDDADYFAVLGLERDATPHEIARAYDRLAAEFAPARFAPELALELDADLRLIADTLDEARRVLGDDDVRGAYREHLAAP